MIKIIIELIVAGLILVFVSAVVINSSYSGDWNPCEQKLDTYEKQKRCFLFNKKSEHYKKLNDAVKGLGNTVRKPLEIPKGVRMPQQYQQQYQQPYIK